MLCWDLDQRLDKLIFVLILHPTWGLKTCLKFNYFCFRIFLKFLNKVNLFLIYDRLGSLKKFRELVQWPSIYRVASPIFTVVPFKLCICTYCNEEISFFVVFILKSFEFWPFSKLSLLLKSASITFTKEKKSTICKKNCNISFIHDQASTVVNRTW